MKISRLNSYFLLNAVIIILILLYQSFWVFSRTTEGYITEFYKGPDVMGFKEVSLMQVVYTVNKKRYIKEFLRNEISTRTPRVRYSIVFPGISRVNNFTGNWLMPILLFGIPFLFTSMLWFIPNDILPPTCFFIVSKTKPWIKFSAY